MRVLFDSQRMPINDINSSYRDGNRYTGGVFGLAPRLYIPRRTEGRIYCLPEAMRSTSSAESAKVLHDLPGVACTNVQCHVVWLVHATTPAP